MSHPPSTPAAQSHEHPEPISLCQFIEQAPTAMAMFDRDMRYLCVSRRWREDYGVGVESVVGRTPPELFTQAHEKWAEVFRLALAGEVVRRDLDRFSRSGGTDLWLRWEVQPWRRHDGEVGGVVAFTEDITAQKVAEDALRRERDLNAAIINTARMIVLFLDPSGRIVHFNPYFEQLTGWSLDEARGHDWFTSFLPIDQRVPVRSLFEKALGGEPTRGYVNPIVTKVGELRVIEWYDTQLLGENGTPAGLISTGLDVTDRRGTEESLRQREARLSSILDTAADAMILIDDRGVIQSVNPATCAMFGYPEEELHGRNVRVLMPEPYSAEHDNYMTRYLRTGERRIIGIGREVTGKRKDGTTFPIELSVAEIEGPPRQFTGFIRDITERKFLEAKLLRAQRLESIGTLVSGIAHDLNNVLTPVLMAVKLLKKDRPGLDKADLLDTAQRSVERGVEMLRQLLTFSGRLGGEQVLVHLTPLVGEAVRLLDHTLPKSILIRREWPEGLDAVTGDPTQLSQVVMNLCVNARDAMPEGGTLTLSLASTTLDAHGVATHPGAKPGRYLVLSVADTGTGIPPDVQQKMFDPFFTTKPQGQGTGLGLSTALGIVQAHGGFVSVYSELGHGTKVSVYLPVSESESVSVTQSRPSAPVPGRGECILVVDDEAAILATVRATLEAHGYRALAAAGGAEALSLFDTHRTDVRLLLVDMMMPEVDGAAVIAAVRQQSPHLPILAASGLPPTGRFSAAIAAASARFISKPYSDDDLLDVIGRLLAGR